MPIEVHYWVATGNGWQRVRRDAIERHPFRRSRESSFTQSWLIALDALRGDVLTMCEVAEIGCGLAQLAAPMRAGYYGIATIVPNAPPSC